MSKRLQRAALFTLPLLALVLFGGAHAAAATLQGTATLLAGQTTPAGTVAVSSTATDLIVTYTTAPGWEITEAHLWAGTSLATLPVNKAGNPTIGLFPYTSAPGNATSQMFTIPLSSIGATCSSTVFVAAHAALRQVDGSGAVIRTETGWAAGTRITAKGSWATYFSFTLTCPPPPPVVSAPTCETAWGVGPNTLISLGLTTSRWGWEVTVGDGVQYPYSTPIYAGAAQNDLSKGTLVGNLIVNRSGATYTVTFQMLPGYTLEHTHLYAGATHVATISPGQFPYQHDLTATSSDTYTVTVAGSPVYLAAHAEVCWPH